VDQKPQDKKHRLWSWKEFGITLCLIPIGLLLFAWGFFSALGHMGSSGWSGEEGLILLGLSSRLSEFITLGGLCIAVVGIIWFLVLLNRLIVLRYHKKHRYWLWLAIILIPIGHLLFVWGLGVTISSQAVEVSDWLLAIAVFCLFFAGPLIAVIGIIWTIALLNLRKKEDRQKSLPQPLYR